MNGNAARGWRGRAAPALLMVATMMIAAACSGTGGSPSTATAPPATTAPPTQAAAATPSPLPASALITKIQAAGVLNVGYAVALPWLFLDPGTNKYVGANAAIAEALAQRLGVKVVAVPTAFSALVAGIQTGKIDLASSPMSITPERLKAIDMVPFTLDGLCYAILKTNTTINSLADLNNANVTLGNFQGSSGLSETQTKYPLAKQYVRAPQPGELGSFVDVESGKADAGVFDSVNVLIVQAKYPDLRVLPTDCLANPDIPAPIGVGIPQGDAGFKELVTSTITGMSSQINDLIAQYGDPKYYQ